MSFPIAHFALGAGLTSLLVAVLAPRFRFQRTVLFLGGVWGMIPDLSHFLESVELLATLHGTKWGNLFFFHHRLDLIDSGDSFAFAAAVVGLSLGLVVASELVGLLQPVVLRAVREQVGGSDGADRNRL